MEIGHIALYVQELERAREFFVRYLGAASDGGYHNPKTGFRSYFLTFDGGARLELMHRPDMAALPKDPVRAGYAHIAFRVGQPGAGGRPDRPAAERWVRGGQRAADDGGRLL